MNITPNNSQIPSGEKLILNIQPPVDRRFISGVRVATERSTNAEGEVTFSSYLTQLKIGDIQEQHGLGEAFSLEVDTLFYEAGTYYFFTFAPGDPQNVWCEVEILPPSAAIRERISGSFAASGEVLRIFDSEGHELSADPDIHPLPVLRTDSHYYLGIHLAGISAIAPQVEVDFMDEAGNTLLFSQLLTIYTFPQETTTQDISFNENCEGHFVPRNPLTTPIHYFAFRTPDHLVYYEYDGVLRFSLNIKTGPSCSPSGFSLMLFWMMGQPFLLSQATRPLSRKTILSIAADCIAIH
jgi:hypothetical protein